MSMKKLKRVLPFSLALILASVSLPVTALADSAKVVTLGANLSDEQKASMYKYFGTSADQVDTIEVTNTDERKYMEGIATESQIGTRTYSCSYVEPTDSGGIQVKVANLTFVTSSMIASTLLTSGVENCNVVAGSPIEVSGTGALTGIMMAYEKASGKELSDNLDGKSGGFFSNLWSSIKGFFGGDSSGGGIINNTDDAALGNDAIIDSTLDAVKSKANDAVNQAKEEGLWDKIVGFFKDLFGGDDTENSDNTDSTDAVEENTDNNTDTGSTDNNADNDTSTNAE